MVSVVVWVSVAVDVPVPVVVAVLLHVVEAVVVVTVASMITSDLIKAVHEISQNYHEYFNEDTMQNSQ